jgi:hypothetical protein
VPHPGDDDPSKDILLMTQRDTEEVRSDKATQKPHHCQALRKAETVFLMYRVGSTLTVCISRRGLALGSTNTHSTHTIKYTAHAHTNTHTRQIRTGIVGALTPHHSSGCVTAHSCRAAAHSSRAALSVLTKKDTSTAHSCQAALSVGLAGKVEG